MLLAVGALFVVGCGGGGTALQAASSTTSVGVTTPPQVATSEAPEPTSAPVATTTNMPEVPTTSVVAVEEAVPATTGAPPATTEPPATTAVPATTEPPVATTAVPATTEPPAATTAVPATTEPPAATTTVPPTTAVEHTWTLDLTSGPVPGRYAAYQPYFSKHVEAFGVPVFATPATPDSKLEHAGNVLAQYIDNDADGEPDDPAVPEMMANLAAALVMGADPDDLDESGIWDAEDGIGNLQELLGDETDQPGEFDFALEEIHHLIYNYGWVPNHREVLSDSRASDLTDAMDLARGGHFGQIPDEYPAAAWYHYFDDSCEYSCMVSEYIYWANTTLMGAQQQVPGRCDEIAEEWEPCTPTQLRAVDPAVVVILEDPAIGFPMVAPDGNYTGR
ncbi:MAG: hypothetical protein ISR43_01050 [Acidimicrobiia bacterium]|nr:hypothetical protein [Acidimicrobiia bacterium]MBL6925800.1 hypothetical protein [Acidimicrobiia bacterium]